MSEYRTDHIDEGFIHVDYWETEDDNEGGRVIAKINVDTSEIIYIDKSHENNPRTTMIINKARLNWAIAQLEVMHEIEEESKQTKNETR